jgi:hypothetical protein
VTADDAFAIGNKEMEKIENLRLDVAQFAAATQFPPLHVERIAFEPVFQFPARLPIPGPAYPRRTASVAPNR